MDNEERWLTNFSASAPTDAELRTRLDSCGGEEDRELRQIIKDNLTLRWSARVLLEHVRMTPGIVVDETDENSALRIALSLIEHRRPD